MMDRPMTWTLFALAFLAMMVIASFNDGDVIGYGAVVWICLATSAIIRVIKDRASVDVKITIKEGTDV